MNADSEITVSGNRVALTHEHRGGIAPDTTSLRPDSTWLERIGGADKVHQLIDTGDAADKTAWLFVTVQGRC